jgi:hypothetical protein
MLQVLHQEHEYSIIIHVARLFAFDLPNDMAIDAYIAIDEIEAIKIAVCCFVNKFMLMK